MRASAATASHMEMSVADRRLAGLSDVFRGGALLINHTICGDPRFYDVRLNNKFGV